MLRQIERFAEKALTLFYNERDHERHYRRIMATRALFRGFRGTSLTNTPEQGLPIFRQVAALSRFDGTQSVLDYGCGEAGVGVHFAKAITTGRYCGVDISPPALATAQARLSGLARVGVSQIESAADVDGKFDIIFAQSVFTHCPMPVFEQFLGMARRCLSPDGVVLANFAISDAASRIDRTDFVFTKALVEATVTQCGFACSIAETWVHPAQRNRAVDAPHDTMFVLTEA